MFIVDVKKINQEQLAQNEKEFLALLEKNPGETAKVWSALHKNMGSLTAQQDKEYFFNYLRWYTQLTWGRFNQLDASTLADVVFGRQVFAALLQGNDPIDRLMWYLNLNVVDEAGKKALFSKIKAAFLGSNIVVGEENGTNVTLGSLYEDIRRMDEAGNDSMKVAEFMTRVNGMLKKSYDEKMWEEYVSVTVEDASSLLIDLCHFFIGITPDNIQHMVDYYVEAPSRYASKNLGQVLQQVEEAASLPQAPVALKSTVPKPSPPPEKKEPPKSAPATKAPPPVKQVTPAPQVVKKEVSYKDIKKMIESRFERDTDGQFTNVEGVLTLLDGLADEKGDEELRELYYFDEQTGMFRWNSDLLK